MNNSPINTVPRFSHGIIRSYFLLQLLFHILNYFLGLWCFEHKKKKLYLLSFNFFCLVILLVLQRWLANMSHEMSRSQFFKPFAYFLFLYHENTKKSYCSSWEGTPASAFWKGVDSSVLRSHGVISTPPCILQL